MRNLGFYSPYKLHGICLPASVESKERFPNCNSALKVWNLLVHGLQFLPQDRVVAFAQLKPTELLLETEKAVGDAELLKLHNKLIERRNNLKGLETVRASAHSSAKQKGTPYRNISVVLFFTGVRVC